MIVQRDQITGYLCSITESLSSLVVLKVRNKGPYPAQTISDQVQGSPPRSIFETIITINKQ